VVGLADDRITQSDEDIALSWTFILETTRSGACAAVRPRPCSAAAREEGASLIFNVGSCRCGTCRGSRSRRRARCCM